MKQIFQLIALLALGLTFLSCEKSDPKYNGFKGQIADEVHRFELNSSLGALNLEPLSSNTNDISDDDLRATLYFKNSNSPATTTLKADDFGLNKRLARWGVIYDGGKKYALNCDDAVSVEPNNPSNNTVFFKGTTTDNTIEGASLRMYCRSLKTLDDITKGIMMLEGKAGTEPNSTKLYFKGETNTDPNHRIEGLQGNTFQEDRHIPIMTKLEEFSEMTKPLATTEVKFGPRGSLIGLNIKNRTNTNIIVTAIEVEKSGALDYSGYFDWGEVDSDKRATFKVEYPAGSATTLSFPVYASKTAPEVGYTIAQNNREIPCFYVWGFQNPDKKGQDFQVKIRYKTTPTGTEQTTRIFNVHAPNSVVDGVAKQFDDGYSYHTNLTINSSNKTGSANGNDWNYGGTLSSEEEKIEKPKIISFSVSKTDITDDGLLKIEKSEKDSEINYNQKKHHTILNVLDGDVYIYYSESVPGDEEQIQCDIIIEGDNIDGVEDLVSVHKNSFGSSAPPFPVVELAHETPSQRKFRIVFSRFQNSMGYLPSHFEQFSNYFEFSVKGGASFRVYPYIILFQ